MKLYTAHRAPHPRRVLMFMVEKGIDAVERVDVDLLHGEQHGQPFRSRNPVGKIPVLELDDGRLLTESRAICSYLEGLQPEPNLMGRGDEEHAFIEMQDRRVEWYWMVPIIAWMRHTLPGTEALEPRQVPEYAEQQRQLALKSAAWLDETLARQPWLAGERFTVADITAFCALEVARVMRFHAGEHGLHALQAWRDRVFARDSARVE